MKKLLVIVVMCLGLCGCQSLPVPMLIDQGNPQIGMTKQDIMKKCGAPNSYSRQVINGKTYETWYYYIFSGTYDFVDNVLVGYFKSSRYYIKDNVDDLRTYNQKK
jgi:hypothetical protein